MQFQFPKYFFCFNCMLEDKKFICDLSVGESLCKQPDDFNLYFAKLVMFDFIIFIPLSLLRRCNESHSFLECTLASKSAPVLTASLKFPIGFYSKLNLWQCPLMVSIQPLQIKLIREEVMSTPFFLASFCVFLPSDM